MIQDVWGEFRGKRILLLQGPVGPFFRRVSRLLRAVGAEVYKVNFNGGDCLFYPTGAMVWRGSMEDWPRHFESLLDTFGIDAVLLFGDCRPIHRVARTIAHRRGVTVGAFEEGYVRPNFITFDHYGVNGYSRLPRHPGFYHALPIVPNITEREVGKTFWHMALWSALYYLASSLLHPLFRRYRHHRRLSAVEALPWLRSAWRKAAYTWKERHILDLLTGPLSKKYYLVPLQVSVDSQVVQHSEFNSVAEFIRHTVSSFARHAPPDTTLVIKHHPMDRGYHDYSRLIRDLEAEFGIAGRLFYIHDQHLPTLFKHMRGAVVINSTVGLSALGHHAAVKVCGVAVYDIEGLTFRGTLDEFWHGSQTFRPDHKLFARFRAYLIDRTQINGSLYKGTIGTDLCAIMASWKYGYAPPPDHATRAASGASARLAET
jgi:capsular polysaccharide export protein